MTSKINARRGSLLERFQMFEGATYVYALRWLSAVVHVPVNRGEFPDGAKRRNRTEETPRGRTERRGVPASYSLARVVNGTGREERCGETVFRVMFRATESGKASNAKLRDATGIH